MSVHRHPRFAASQLAMALAVRGLPVFPCRGSNKHPCTPHGFYDAVRTPTDAQELFRRYPGELVGIPTGPASGFDVLDIDPRHGGDVWLKANADSLPTTRTHSTRGGGLHFLFEHHPGVRNSENGIAPGVDTRGEGGYIIWWPGAGGEITCHSPITTWPQWLLTILIPPPAPPPVQVQRSHSVCTDTATRRMITRALDRVARAQPGDRHHKLRAASRTLGGLLKRADIGRSEVERDLLDAVLQAGGNDVHRKNAEATIKWGLDKGEREPFGFGIENG